MPTTRCVETERQQHNHILQKPFTFNFNHFLCFSFSYIPHVNIYGISDHNGIIIFVII